MQTVVREDTASPTRQRWFRTVVIGKGLDDSADSPPTEEGEEPGAGDRDAGGTRVQSEGRPRNPGPGNSGP